MSGRRDDLEVGRTMIPPSVGDAIRRVTPEMREQQRREERDTRDERRRLSDLAGIDEIFFHQDLKRLKRLTARFLANVDIATWVDDDGLPVIASFAKIQRSRRVAEKYAKTLNRSVEQIRAWAATEAKRGRSSNYTFECRCEFVIEISRIWRTRGGSGRGMSKTPKTKPQKYQGPLYNLVYELVKATGLDEKRTAKILPPSTLLRTIDLTLEEAKIEPKATVESIGAFIGRNGR